MGYALQVRLTDEEIEKLRALAKERGMSLSTFVRMELMRLARKRKVLR